MRFCIEGHTSVIKTRVPSTKEINECEHVTLTGDAPREPDDSDWAQQEAKFTRTSRHRQKARTKIGSARARTTVIIDPYTSHTRMAHPVSSGIRRVDVPLEDVRRCLGMVPMEVAEHTLAYTTQLAERCGKMPLSHRYKTNI